jgi:YebC/PmpR family DNA-binding regulatory protein
MSGHNKWSKVKHKKSATDAKKSKIFSSLSRAITLESKAVGGDVNSPGLRSVIEKARSLNMPSDNIDRAVKRGVGKDASLLEGVLYETYGPGGTAIIIEGITDNKNRTSSEVKHILSKKGFALSPPGSASWAFEKKEDVWVPKNILEISADDIEALAVLIEDLEGHGDINSVYTNTNI